MRPFSEIDQERAQAGIDQKELATRAGMKPQTYTKLKRPGRRGATEATLKRLAEALETIIAEQDAANG